MDPVSFLIAASGVLLAAGVILASVKKTVGFFRKMVHLFDEILGRDGVAGSAPTPGISARIAEIEAHLRPNGGTSLRDQINRLEVWTAQHTGMHHELEHRIKNPTN